MMGQRSGYRLVVILMTMAFNSFVIVLSGDNQSESGLQGYPEFVDLLIANPNRDGIGHPGQLIINSVNFSCEGYIVQWELYCVDNGPHPIEFHIWRRDGTSNGNVYNLVGRNFISDSEPDPNNALSYSVPEGQQIQVQPGDVVGIRTFRESNDTENPYLLQAHTTNSDGLSMLTYILQESDDTPSTLDLDDMPTFRFDLLPVMRITMRSMQQSTTSTVSTTDPTNPFPQSAIIAIAVLSSVIGIFVLFVVVGVIVCCCIRQYKYRSQTTNKVSGRTHRAAHDLNQDDLEMQYNAAYNGSSKQTPDATYSGNYGVGGQQNKEEGVYYSTVADIDNGRVNEEDGDEEYEEMH